MCGRETLESLTLFGFLLRIRLMRWHTHSVNYMIKFVKRLVCSIDSHFFFSLSLALLEIFARVFFFVGLARANERKCAEFRLEIHIMFTLDFDCRTYEILRSMNPSVSNYWDCEQSICRGRDFLVVSSLLVVFFRRSFTLVKNARKNAHFAVLTQSAWRWGRSWFMIC